MLTQILAFTVLASWLVCIGMSLGKGEVKGGPASIFMFGSLALAVAAIVNA